MDIGGGPVLSSEMAKGEFSVNETSVRLKPICPMVLFLQHYLLPRWPKMSAAVWTCC